MFFHFILNLQFSVICFDFLCLCPSAEMQIQKGGRRLCALFSSMLFPSHFIYWGEGAAGRFSNWGNTQVFKGLRPKLRQKILETDPKQHGCQHQWAIMGRIEVILISPEQSLQTLIKFLFDSARTGIMYHTKVFSVHSYFIMICYHMWVRNHVIIGHSTIKPYLLYIRFYTQLKES